MVLGVSEGFSKNLEIEKGVGFKAAVQGRDHSISRWKISSILFPIEKSKSP